MIRKGVFGVCLAVGILFSAQCIAQRGIRHVKGIKAVDGFGGVTGHGVFYGGGYTSYLADNWYWKAGAYMENGKQSELSYKSYGLDISGAFTFKEFNETIFLNVNGGVTGAMYSAGKSNYYSSVSEIKFGGFIGPEVEIFLHDKVVLVLNWNQRYYMMGGDVVKNTRWFGGAAIRFNLNN